MKQKRDDLELLLHGRMHSCGFLCGISRGKERMKGDEVVGEGMVEGFMV